MSSLRLHFWSIAGTLIAFLASLWINQEVFTHTSFVRGVNWIFLPSGVRLLSTLLVGFDGALGLLLAGLITDFLYWFPHDPVRAIAGALLGSLAPYLVYRFALEYFDLRASLTNLTPKRLLVLAVAYSGANTLFHHLWFALAGTTKNWFESFFTMFVGDLAGALIILYVIKALLALLPKQPGNSRVSNGMFSIQLALNNAYANQFATKATWPRSAAVHDPGVALHGRAGVEKL
ncbi:putative MnhB-related membrane protein [Paraburkholderia sp. UCT70]